ncbi:WD40/YVTN/BNR-like repeat-containing protein [Arundinibacter roseus]|uniref:Photosynthesis system II assembly factor Ycf48/Hcf136-like domain-containing protein n=1 Tax=Arundinibacter roseus TaxID=2070510 RepID=A0A4R4KR24_9BACT|nr:YCF48-related protein [Arundinibacter roseus]TDB68851.1 hypothetical protein EZE20_00450 [Arundinibacter roseus]
MALKMLSGVKWIVNRVTCSIVLVSVFFSITSAANAYAFTISGPESVCIGATATLTASGCTGNLRWSTGESSNSIQVSPVATTLYYAVCNTPAGQSSASHVLVVFPKPSIETNTSTLCSNAQVLLTARGLSANTPFVWKRDGVALPETSPTLLAKDAGTYSLETAQISQWASFAPVPSGTEFRDIAFIDSLLGYAVGREGKAFKTTDGGQFWSPLALPVQTDLEAVFFVDNLTGWIVSAYANAQLFKTTDGGQTWSESRLSNASGIQAMHFASQTHGWIVGNNGLILRTINGGTTWTQQNSGTSNWLYGVHFISETTGYAVGENGTLLYTTNGGNTWTSQTGGAGGFFTAVSFHTATSGWAGGYNGALLKTTDAGQTWIPVTLPFTENISAIALPNDSTLWISTLEGSLMQSTNHGESFTYQNNPAQFGQLNALAWKGQTGYLAGTGGRLLRTTTNGNHWMLYGSQLRNDLLGAHFLNNSTGWVVGAEGYIGKTDDGGKSWQTQDSQTPFNLHDVNFVNGNQGWAVGDGSILFTNNGGNSWQMQISGLFSSFRDIFPFDGSLAWVAGSEGTIRRTFNAGQEWQFIQTSTTQDLNAIHFVTPQTGWAVGRNGTIIKTTNVGSNWTTQNSGSLADLQCVFFVNTSIGIASGGGQTLRTTNGGDTWENLNINAGFRDVYIYPDGTGWGLTSSTAYYTADFGQSWTSSGSFSADFSARAASISPAAGFAVGLHGFLARLIPPQSCASASITISPNHSPDFLLTSSVTNYICNNESITLTAANCNGTVRWSTGQTSSSITVSPQTTTVYQATCDMGGNCPLERSLTVGVQSKPLLSASAGPLCANDSVILQSSVLPVIWKKNGEMLPAHTASGQLLALQEGTYTAENTPVWSAILPLPSTQDFQAVFFSTSQIGYAAGKEGTVYKTTNGGALWQKLTAPSSESLISLHFISPDTGWLLASSGTVYRTTDGGQNWASAPGNVLTPAQKIWFSDASNGWITGSNGSIQRTTNGGQEWTSQASGTTRLLRSMFFLNQNKGWAVGVNGTFLKTSNGGDTWENQGDITGQDITAVQFLSESEGWITGNNLLLHTTDGGTTWTSPSAALPALYYRDLYFTNSQHGWIMAGEGIIYTKNGGETWDFYSNETLSFYPKAIFFTDNQKGFMVAEAGKILQTTNGGISWALYGSSLRESIISMAFATEAVGWAGTQNGTLSKTINGGQSWTSQKRFEHPILDVQFNDVTTGWLTDGQIWRTTNGGDSWELRQNDFGHSHLFSTDSQHAWATTSTGSVLRTTDGGQTWQTSNLNGNPVPGDLYFVDNQTGWFVGNQGKILKTSDGGATWNSQNSGTTQFLTSISFMNSSVGIVGGDGVLLRTTNGGATWTQVSAAFNQIPFLHLSAEGPAWLSNGTGMYISTDFGATWAAVTGAGSPAMPLFTGTFLANGTKGWVAGFSGYVAGLTSAAGNCRISDPISLIPPPVPPILSASDTSIPLPGTVTLTASGCDGSVQWSDGVVATERSVLITSTSIFSAICTTANGCTSLASDTLTVSVGGPAVAVLSGSQLIQSGQTATLTVTLSGIAPWTLQFNGQTYSNIQTPTFELTVMPYTTTTYTLSSVSNSLGTGSVSGSATISVFNICDVLEPNNAAATAFPITSNVYTSPPICLNTTTDNDWFQWLYNGKVYYILVHPYAYNSTGNYQLTLTLNLATGQVEIETRSVNGSQTDTFLRLFDSDGLTELMADDDGGENAFSKIVYTLPPCSQDVVQTQRSGTWNDPFVWACGAIPTSLDNTRVNVGHEITLPAGYMATVKNLEMNGEINYLPNSGFSFGQ